MRTINLSELNPREQAFAKQIYDVELVLNLDTGLEEVDIPQESVEILRKVGITFAV